MDETSMENLKIVAKGPAEEEVRVAAGWKLVKELAAGGMYGGLFDIYRDEEMPMGARLPALAEFMIAGMGALTGCKNGLPVYLSANSVYMAVAADGRFADDVREAAGLKLVAAYDDRSSYWTMNYNALASMAKDEKLLEAVRKAAQERVVPVGKAVIEILKQQGWYNYEDAPRYTELAVMADDKVLPTELRQAAKEAYHEKSMTEIASLTEYGNWGDLKKIASNKNIPGEYRKTAENRIEEARKNFVEGAIMEGDDREIGYIAKNYEGELPRELQAKAAGILAKKAGIEVVRPVPGSNGGELLDAHVAKRPALDPAVQNAQKQTWMGRLFHRH